MFSFIKKLYTIRGLYEEKKLVFLLKRSSRKGVTYIKRNPKLIISLTSYPKRFKSVLLTLESLLRQNTKPDKIVLWLAKKDIEKNTHFIKELDRLSTRGVEIVLLNRDLKSFNKLIPALRAYPNDIIVTCDDDVIYPNNFLEKLYDIYLENKESICAYRCAYIQKKDDGSLYPYREWRHAKKDDYSENLFPTGVGGILYPPNSLHSDVTKEDLFLHLAPTADDVWFKAMALKAGTKVAMVNETFTEFTTLRNSQDYALWKTNVTESQNDMQIKKVFDYYNLYKLVK